jgi:hypothetical protein
MCGGQRWRWIPAHMWLMVSGQLSCRLQRWVTEEGGDFRLRFDDAEGCWMVQFFSSADTWSSDWVSIDRN